MIIGSWRIGSLEAVAIESADRSGEDEVTLSKKRVQRVDPEMATLLTLRVPRSALVWRVRIVGRGISHLSVVLVHHSTAGGSTVLAGDLVVGGLVSDRRELRTDTAAVGRWLTVRWVRGVGSFNLVGLDSLSGSALTLLDGLTLSIFFLLASFPFLADFLEF
jgi:hypothetical protein